LIPDRQRLPGGAQDRLRQIGEKWSLAYLQPSGAARIVAEKHRRNR